MFIFDRCYRSSAAMTPVKYECDSKNVTGTFASSKILLTEKLTNRALVTPTPENELTTDTPQLALTGKLCPLKVFGKMIIQKEGFYCTDI